MIERRFFQQHRWIMLWVAAALVGVGLLLLLTDDAGQLGGIGWQEMVIVLLIVGAVPLLLLVMTALGPGSGPYQLRQWVPLPPDRIRAHALRWYAAEGWAMTGGGDTDALAFRRRPPPNTAVAVLLFFLGIVPLIVYLLIGGREQTTTIIASPLPDGSDLELFVTPQGSGGRASATRFFNSLHDLAAPASSRRPSRAHPVA